MSRKIGIGIGVLVVGSYLGSLIPEEVWRSVGLVLSVLMVLGLIAYMGRGFVEWWRNELPESGCPECRSSLYWDSLEQQCKQCHYVFKAPATPNWIRKSLGCMAGLVLLLAVPLVIMNGVMGVLGYHRRDPYIPDWVTILAMLSAGVTGLAVFLNPSVRRFFRWVDSEGP